MIADTPSFVLSLDEVEVVGLERVINEYANPYTKHVQHVVTNMLTMYSDCV